MERLQRFTMVVTHILVLVVSGYAYRADTLAATQDAAIKSEPVEPTTIAVAPTLPTTSDAVQITVAGIWSHGCVPYYVDHAMVAPTILITTAVPGPEIVCGQSITPWSIIVELDTLSADTYQIEVQGAVVVTSTMVVLGNQIYLPLIGG